VEGHVRHLAASLRDVDVRKAASALTTLANEKQKEQRDKASGKKKGVTKAAKPILGGAKTAARCVPTPTMPHFLLMNVTRVDTNRYEEALDDFGPDDFM
jgi:translation initiation factor 3 subunit J